MSDVPFYEDGVLKTLPQAAYDARFGGTSAVPTPANLVAYAAAARYALETAGIMVGTSMIATDRDSQGLITGAYNYVLAKPDASIEFKGVSGWVTLTADQVQTIALAVGGRVQALFAAERQVDAAIQAGTITTTAQIDAALMGAAGG